MAAYTWTVTATTTDWSSTTAWSPTAGAPPGSTSTRTDVADLAPIGSGVTGGYTVTVSSGELFDISRLNIGAASGAHNPALSIVGGAKGSATLLLDTLNYTTAATGPGTTIALGTGGVLDIRTAITDAGKAQTISISGKGQGGIGSGGHLEFGSLTVDDPNVSYDFLNNSAKGNNTGVIEFQSGFTTGSTTNQHIKDVGNLDEFIVDGANFSGDTVTFNAGTLTVKNGAATVFTMNNVALQSQFSGTFVASGDVIRAVCYVRGTLIRTPDGELAVERLRPGRQVITLVEDQHVAGTVKWLGHRRISLTNHPRPETVAPVRICRDAFADGVPHRDLMVSPDHAIFVDGKLICARQLVNGGTIRQEFDWTAVDYYHVELDRHAILLAEGLPAESYIDTGNSGFFSNSGAPLLLHPELTDRSNNPTREAGSCAPFVWDEASVQPVWQRLAERAATLGRPGPQRTTTIDPVVRLRTKSRTLKPLYANHDLVIFTLPRGVREVRLQSRAQSPTRARPWLEDRRTLGVRVSRIVLRGAHELREVPVDHPDLAQGWWAVERDGQVLSRWTDGDAMVPLPALQGDAMLEIHLAGTMTYALDEVPANEAEHRAA